jgi:hypothetical protein
MRVVILFQIVLIPFFLSAQENVIDDRKPLQFIIGTEYRITPIYSLKISSLSEQSIFTNIDAQNSGVALNLGLEYEFIRNLGVGFSNAFRYDLVIGQRPEGDNTINVGAPDYRLIIDYHLYLKYNYNVFPKGDIFISAGLSLLNTNTSYTIKEIDEYGEGFYISDFSFFANRISLGFQLSKSRIYLGLNLSRTTDYFNETISFIIPHIGFTYSLSGI